MSINHSYNIANSGNIQVVLNIAGLDSGDCSINDLSASIYAYDTRSGESRFTCPLTINDLKGLLLHLEQYRMLKDERVTTVGKLVEISEKNESIFEYLASSNQETLILALQRIVKGRISSEDLNIILGRKEALFEFEKMLKDGELKEKNWQEFFERNDWIFGYGLKYRYLKILQREAHVSNSDIGGDNDVIADYLLSDLKFTKIVEIKRPDTPIFKNVQNRSDSWRLSNELSDSVSQILAQKANWEINSQRNNFTLDGNLVKELSHDVECILIIGKINSTTGTDREVAMKLKTLELYRRNLRHIDIITYDELFERASFILNDKSKNVG